MEYAAGGELYDLICRGLLNENEARRIFQQIIFGVEYLHTHQVAHRDLKPENILLDDNTKDMLIKIIDWGCAVSFSGGKKCMKPMELRTISHQRC